MSIDFSFVINSLYRSLPFEGMKIYIEIGAEDSSGNGWPKEKAFLAGVLLEEPLHLNNINLRVEWATTTVNRKYDAWYNGYNYEGRIIGHHMGPDAEDIFMRIEYFTGGGIRIGVETDIERKDIHPEPTEPTAKRIWVGFDLKYPLFKTIDIGAGYGFENLEDRDESSHIAWYSVNWDF